MDKRKALSRAVLLVGKVLHMVLWLPVVVSLKHSAQAQRAAERGADADVDSAKQQLAAAQLELEVAMREQSALVSMSNQVHSLVLALLVSCL